MGYKMIWYAVETIDGEKVPESTAVGSTSVFKDQADKFIQMLYGKDADGASGAESAEAAAS